MIEEAEDANLFFDLVGIMGIDPHVEFQSIMKEQYSNWSDDQLDKYIVSTEDIVRLPAYRNYWRLRGMWD